LKLGKSGSKFGLTDERKTARESKKEGINRIHE
jgi:hypothetical protein